MTDPGRVGSPCTPSLTNVTISIVDLSPSFPSGDYYGSIEEQGEDDTLVLTVGETLADFLTFHHGFK